MDHSTDAGARADDRLPDLFAAIASLLTPPPASLTDEALDDAVVQVQQALTCLAAAQTSMVAAWEERRCWAGRGAPNAAADLAHRTGTDPATARQLCRRARRLRTMPVTAAAFARGEISADHVDVLVRANRSSVAELFSRDEAVLVGQAKALSFAHFTKAVRYWTSCADDARAEGDADRSHERRNLGYGVDHEGVTHIRSDLDAVNGAIWRTELERLEELLFNADWAAARAVHGDETCAAHLARTPAQRRADALALMAERSASAEPGASGRPLLSVLVDLDTLRDDVVGGGASSAGGDDDDAAARRSQGTRARTPRTCELSDGTVLTPGQVLALLGTAHVERIVLDGPSRVLDVGVRRRLFSGATRRAVEVRDRCCTAPGCTIPAERCEVDHIVPFSEGGATVTSNGRLLCRSHHRHRDRASPP